MTANELPPAALGLPALTPAATAAANGPFGLSSHAAAREALAFGLGIAQPGFNIFVVGPDLSGRMNATMEFLRAALGMRPPPSDWLYLNNFRRPHRPRPVNVPPGIGRRFRDRVGALVPMLREALGATFSSETGQERLQARGRDLRAEFARRIEALRAEARKSGLDITQTPQGFTVVRAENAAPPETPEATAAQEAVARTVVEQLAEIQRWAAAGQAEASEATEGAAKLLADAAISPLLDAIEAEFAPYPTLVRWLIAARADIIDNLGRFQAEPPPGVVPAERFYAVNLLVDRTDETNASVVLEPNPTYENLFGRIEYRPNPTGLETDFTLLRAGALHRANGGVLVLRAEALAGQPLAWQFLKGALRDRAIRIEEPMRTGSAPPIAGAPRPKPIPLDVKVVLVGAPLWFYTFFMADPDFRTHFRIKAEIDPDMPATQTNVDVYAALVQRMTMAANRCPLAPGAVARLVRLATRNAADRDRLSAQFEMAEDLIEEACNLAGLRKASAVAEADVRSAELHRRRRNGHVEDRSQEAIARGLVMIETEGAVIGQVNGLVYRDVGDHQFGGPARVTARASVGRRGVLNIERDVQMGGPIQQKAAMILQGFLAGRLARHHTLSFDCYNTIEQRIEGDSASLAELVAVISDLAELPVRQDVAVTGSANQRGLAQAVGGVHIKIEGFYRTCVVRGLTGTQGCVVPSANEAHLVLDDEVVAAVAAGRFHVWSVTSIDEVLELMLATPPAEVYARVEATLESFNAALNRSERL
jgi:predicted ATP-dependent protease